jgi:hypothetical protein
MAKGQMRSNREAKKPKKSAAEKAKPGQSSVFTQPAPGSARPPSKQR